MGGMGRGGVRDIRLEVAGSGYEEKERGEGGEEGEDRWREQEVSMSHTGPAVHVRVRCLLRTPDCWRGNSPENFKVSGEDNLGSSQTIVRGLD